MPRKFVSPGVFTQEIDQSYLAQGVAAIGAAVTLGLAIASQTKPAAAQGAIVYGQQQVMAGEREPEVIAPVREWQMGRDEEIAYAHEHGIPVSSSVERPYSIDDNLWGRSSEGGVIEDLTQAVPDDVFQLITPPTKAAGPCS